MSSRSWSSSANLMAREISARATEAVLEELEVTGEPMVAQASAADTEDPDAADPDHDIVHLITIGASSAALRSLMQRHGTAVYRYCRSTLRDNALADDVHQQIFIEAYRDLGRFAGRATLRTWLFAIARHRVLDAVKARRRALVHLEERNTTNVPDPSPPPGERIDDVRLREALGACFDELGEHLRTAVLLRYQQGFTFEDMAVVCGEKPGTLQARVMRALPKLRACLEARTRGRL